jgi:hypothetical protein
VGVPEVIQEVASVGKVEFSIERALFAMIANRACEPSSKRWCSLRWLAEGVRISGTENLSLQHLYRAMDVLEANRSRVEEAIFFRLADLHNLDVDLIFYDTTSLHFEIEEQDQGVGPDREVVGSVAAGAKTYRALRQLGHSKNGRSDAPQIVIGLAVTRDGIPVRHWIFPGNTVDVTTVEHVKGDLRGWKLGRCVFVGDAGMVSRENLRKLSLGAGKYVVCMPMRHRDEVTKEVLGRPGRFRRVADNLKVKEVVVGQDGERRRRYAVCFNPLEQKRQRDHRAQVLAELEAEVSSLQRATGEEHTKRMCELRSSRRYGKYLRLARGGRLEIDRGKISREQRLDGKFVVHTNDDTLTAEDMALAYKQLMRVEEAWRSLKSGLRLRPVYHYVPHRIHAHVSLTILALLLERLIERDCADTWRNVRADLQQIKLAHLSGPNGDVWQVTEPDQAASNRLKALKINNPPPIFAL